LRSGISSDTAGNRTRFFRSPAHKLVTVTKVKRLVTSIKFQVVEPALSNILQIDKLLLMLL
jgi:hypothetical protein